MRKIYIAFLISLFIHLLFFLNLNTFIVDKDKKSNENIKPHKTSDIKFVKLLEPEIIQESKKEQKTIKKTEEPIIKKSPSEEVKKEFKKELKEAKEFQESVLNESSTLQKNLLEDFLSQKDEIANTEVFNELRELYGNEYDNFTKVQKAYLEKNINNFQIITQRALNRLGYPYEAARLKISGINIVEFIFHPNGDISNLRIISSSGYTIFDEHTLELIRVAYKDYPKPKESTTLRFKVFYRFY